MKESKKGARSAATLQARKMINKNKYLLYFSAWAGVVSTVLIGWNVTNIQTGAACLLSFLVTMELQSILINGGHYEGIKAEEDGAVHDTTRARHEKK